MLNKICIMLISIVFISCSTLSLAKNNDKIIMELVKLLSNKDYMIKQINQSQNILMYVSVDGKYNSIQQKDIELLSNLSDCYLHDTLNIRKNISEIRFKESFYLETTDGVFWTYVSQYSTIMKCEDYNVQLTFLSLGEELILTSVQLLKDTNPDKRHNAVPRMQYD